MIRSTQKIITAILFQCGWWINIGAAIYKLEIAATVLTLIIIGIYLLFLCPKSSRLKELMIISFVGAYGFLGDSLLNYLEVFKFVVKSDFIPMWLLMIWLLFAMTSGLYEYLKNNQKWAFILGAIFGPLSYAAGLKFSLLTFPLDWLSIAILAIVWGWNFPALLYLRKKIYTS